MGNLMYCALSMQVIFTPSCGSFIAALSLALGSFSLSSRKQNRIRPGGLETLVLYQVVANQLEILL